MRKDVQEVVLGLSGARKKKLISLLCCNVEIIWAGICESTGFLRTQIWDCHPCRVPWRLVGRNWHRQLVRMGIRDCKRTQESSASLCLTHVCCRFTMDVWRFTWITTLLLAQRGPERRGRTEKGGYFPEQSPSSPKVSHLRACQKVQCLLKCQPSSYSLRFAGVFNAYI